MTRFDGGGRFFLVVVLIGAIQSVCVAADGPKTQAVKRRSPFTQIKDDTALPRVLLIGDSISIGYTLAVRELLEGKVNVHRAPTNCGPTTRGLDQIDAWLGEGSWDVIHFNWGLHDLKYMNAKGQLIDTLDGTQQVVIEKYEENLEKLVTRMKETSASLIFATTTPVPEGSKGRVVGDSAKYNAAAARVMEKHGVATDDLFSFVTPRHEEIMSSPGNVHFTGDGSRLLAEQVVESVERALGE